MVYPVHRSDGSLLANISEYTRDTSSTSLVLFGRQIVNYGEAMAENLVRLLENSASSTPPANPIEGQLWYHTFDPGPPVAAINKLKVFNGVEWVVSGGAQSGTAPPASPQEGDLWYNEATKQIMYWNGNKWIAVGTPNTGLPPGTDPGTIDPTVPVPGPENPTEGELWWMLPERQLWAFDESLKLTSSFPPAAKRVDQSPVPNGWVLVGPTGSKVDNNYTQYTTVVNPTTGEERDIWKVVINGELVAVWTDRIFDVGEGEIDTMPFKTYTNAAGSDGSTVLQPGLNMNHLSGMKLNGVAIDAETLDGLDSTQFLRRDQSDTPEGTDNQYDLGTLESHWRHIHSTKFYGGASDPDGEDDIAEISFHGKSTYAEKTDYAEKAEMFSEGKNITATGMIAGTLTNFAGDATNDYQWEMTFSAAGQESITDTVKDNLQQIIGDNKFVALDKSSVPTGQHNVGNAQNRFGTIFATVFDGEATKSRYADLAERYASDAVYGPGTLVSIGGEKEITSTSGHNDYSFFGVISTNPGYLLNSLPVSEEELEAGLHPAVALTGRVPVKVKGAVKKGDRLVLSSTPGVAKAYHGDVLELNAAFYVGRALSDKETEEVGLVLATVQSK